MPDTVKGNYVEYVQGKGQNRDILEKSWEKLNSDISLYVDQRKNGESFREEVYKWKFLQRWHKKSISTISELKAWIDDKDGSNLLSRRNFGSWFEGILKGERGDDAAVANAFHAFDNIENLSEIKNNPLFKWKNKQNQEKTIPDRDAALYFFLHNPFIYMPYPPRVFKEAEKALLLEPMDIRKWMTLGRVVILKLLALTFKTRIDSKIDFSSLDIDSEGEVVKIKSGQYLCMLDAQDFIWNTYYKPIQARQAMRGVRYWTFKHKPGSNADTNECEKVVSAALASACCMMQQEYDFQAQRSVTKSWNSVKNLAAGDIVFLRGDKQIYAVGKIIAPRCAEDSDHTLHLSMAEIISSKKHGNADQYRSDNFRGIILFDDSDVFYENLTGKAEWGQRIDVDEWKYYCKEGITVNDENYRDNSSAFLVIRELKSEDGKKLVEGMKMASFSREATLLKHNHNLILTGAPGTGKTYCAQKIAAELIEINTESDSWMAQLDNSHRYKFIQFHPSYDYADFVEGLKPKLVSGLVSFEPKSGIFMEFCDVASKDASAAPYVFVIDEINRSDLSRVFGELFFGLEEDYRGKHITTQYSYLRENRKDQPFTIPSNVYIIGTMNDIDRSVESMDFALRRRFVWHEVTVESTQDSILAKIDKAMKIKCVSAMNALNARIGKDLGDEYKLGAAYFKKIEKYNGDFTQLWNNHINIILSEYLRGKKEKHNHLETLRNLYFAAIKAPNTP